MSCKRTFELDANSVFSKCKWTTKVFQMWVVEGWPGLTAKPSIRRHHMNDGMFVLVPSRLKQNDHKGKEDTSKGVTHCDFLFGGDDCPHDSS